MRTAVLGLGRIGSAAAWDIWDRWGEADLVLADARIEALREAASRLRGVETRVVDARDPVSISSLFREVDAAIVALPGRLVPAVWSSAVDEGIDLVDVSYSEESPLGLNSRARAEGITIVPDAGMAPGLSNLAAGRALAELGEPRELVIMVGGVPQEPRPPLGYAITWSPEDLIEEYTRPARIVRGGEVVEVPALSDPVEVDVPGVGRMEAFLTDGLRTLLKTIRGVDRMEERTLRYPGHARAIRFLRDLGLLSREPVVVDGREVIPAEVTVRLLEARLPRDPRDLVVMLVSAVGRDGGRMEFRLIDRYDESTGMTAMARTTAFAATGFLRAVSDGLSPSRGVVPPEAFGASEEAYESVRGWLAERGIRLAEEILEED